MASYGNENVTIESVKVSVYTIPTDFPESDGTLEWTSTTLVFAEVMAGNKRGLGYTYTDNSVAQLIHGLLSKTVIGRDALNTSDCWNAMVRATRNLGRPGIVSCAISAVDTALWDLKAKLLDLPLASLFGAVRESIPVYGSGGFTSYSDHQLTEQLSGWVEQGIKKVKMKIGRDALADRERVQVARTAIGKDVELFVDANGAYSRKQALAQAEAFTKSNVTWFEEPVSSDDLDGLHLIRDRAPAGMEIAAGEYGYDIVYFERMLAAGAVDVLQADATRCGGFTGFLQAAALCQAHQVPLSAHTAPTLHTHVCCAATPVRHVEYFHDHTRIERMLFDGLPEVKDGELFPDPSRPGLGIELKIADAKKFAA
jgi:L-alanine-DL-glutamate epimerase-like enolase superfamily enzyme